MIVGQATATFGSPINPFVGIGDMAIVRLDVNGNLLWNTFAGGAGNDFPGTDAATADGGCLFAGRAAATFGAPIVAHAGARVFYKTIPRSDNRLLVPAFFAAKPIDSIVSRNTRERGHDATVRLAKESRKGLLEAEGRWTVRHRA